MRRRKKRRMREGGCEAGKSSKSKKSKRGEREEMFAQEQQKDRHFLLVN